MSLLPDRSANPTALDVALASARARGAQKALAAIVALIDAVARECGIPPEGAAQAVTLLKPEEAARLYALAKGEPV